MNLDVRVSLKRTFFWVILLLVWVRVFYLQLRNTLGAGDIGDEEYSIFDGEQFGGRIRNQRMKRHRGIGANEKPLGDEFEKIFWFMHVSDLHVSKFGSRGGLPNLQNILKKVYPVIDPAFTVVTGDLTDAKDERKLTSRQFQEEWEMYNSLLQNNSQLLGETNGATSANLYGKWLDMRGNHDCFDVASQESSTNFYRRYSSQRQMEYIRTFDMGFGRYSVVAVDACPTFGPARPFNFYGYLDGYDLDVLERNLGAAGALDSNHTILLSHYPIATMMFRVAKGRGGTPFNQLSERFSVYLCGHLHRLILGLGNDMYAMHGTGFLELELGDMKENGMFRVMAIDHDLISFSDFSLVRGDQAPFLVITNPKDARFLVPMHEPVPLIQQSTHIRVLVFSDVEIVSVKATLKAAYFIDNLNNNQAGVGSSTGKHSVYHNDVDNNDDGDDDAGDREEKWLEDNRPANSFTRITGPFGDPVVLRGGRPSKPGKPLWVIPWSPQSLMKAGVVYFLNVTACDARGSCSWRQNQVTVDGTLLAIQSAGNHVLMLQLGFLLKAIFWILYLTVMVGMLMVPKLWVLYLRWHGRHEIWRQTYARWLVDLHRKKLEAIRLHPLSIVFYAEWMVFSSWFRASELVCHRDVFYTLFLYGLYIVVGPWFIGYLAPSQPSSLVRFYLYGLRVNDGVNFIPVLDTWMFAVFEMAYCYVPVVFYLSFYTTDMDIYQLSTIEDVQVVVAFSSSNAENGSGPKVKRYKNSNVPEPSDETPFEITAEPVSKKVAYIPVFRRWYARLFAIACILYQLLNTALIGIFYGPLAFLISPGKTWFTLAALFLLIKYHRLSSHLRRPIHEKI